MNIEFEQFRGSAAIRALYFATSEGLQERILRADPTVRTTIDHLKQEPALATSFRAELQAVFQMPIAQGRRHPNETLLAAGLYVLSEAASHQSQPLLELFSKAPPETHGLLGRFANWLGKRHGERAPMMRTPPSATAAGNLILDPAEMQAFSSLSNRTDPDRNTTSTRPPIGGIILAN